MKDRILKSFEESVATTGSAGRRLAEAIAEAAEIIIAACRQGGGVFVFGNGGSAADAQHIACELVGRFRAERPALRAEALTTDSSVLTSIANDYSFQTVFARQLQGKARRGDVAVGLTTSGNSPNVVAALAEARRIGMRTIALTGNGGGKCAELADVLLDVPAGATPRIQEAHVVVYHVLCELIEEAFVDRKSVV